MNANSKSPWTDWDLERYICDELPRARRNALGAALQVDAELAGRVRDLRQSDAEIRQKYPASQWVLAITQRAAEQQRHANSKRWAWFAGPVIATGVAVAVLMLRPDTATDFGLQPGCWLQGDEVLCDKGGPSLTVYRRQGDNQVALGQQAEAAAGDVLQLSYSAGGRAYGAIVSVDGRGTITTHFPDGPKAARLQTRGATALSHAYELDDAPLFERFVFVTSNEPFWVSDVVDALRALQISHRNPEAWTSAPLILPDTVEQVWVTLRKSGASR